MAFLLDWSDMDKLTAAVTVKLTEDQKTILERIALCDDTTVSDLLRCAAARIVEEKHQQHLSLMAIFGSAPASDKH